MKPTPSLVKRVLPQPAMHYQTWSWVTILASGLICGLVTWLHFSQIQLLSQTTDAITNMHVARLDLAKGFLYVTLADEAAAPYGREEGLALLQQATASLENITAGLEAGAGAANLAEFRRDLVVFQARLADLRVAAVATPALETEVRIAFHDLENQASELDRQAHHYLTELEGQFNLQFAWVLGGAVVLLAGISVMSVRAEQARHKATQALREREQSLRESQVNFATIFDRSPVAIGISRLQDGQITHLNTAFADLYGLEREEALGHTTAELDLWAQPEDRQRFIERLRAEQQVRNFEAVARLKSGAQRHVIVSGELVNIGGEPSLMAQIVDITERKQLEDSLRESEQRYTLLFQKSGIPVVLMKLPEAIMVDANEAVEKLIGYRREELIGKTTAELGIISYQQRNESIARFGEQGRLKENEIRIVTKTGQERILIVNTHPLEINGQPFAFTAMQDVTERKQAEEKLQESEIKFRALFENSPLQGVIWKLVRDLQGEIVDWEITDINPLGAASIGLQPAEAIGKRAVELFGVEGMTAYLETSRQIAASGQPLLFETHFDANGRDYLSSDFLVGRGHYANISIDITDRKTMEQQLRASERNYRELVQNANSAILRWQGDGTITFFNEFAQAFFGYAAADVLGKPVGLLVPETDSTGGDLSTLVRDIATHPEQFVNVINENIRRDGSRVWMAWTNKPIYDETGQVAEILAVGADITDRKRMEDDLRRSNAELEQFAYVASHDLQEPLRTVAGMMQLLQQRYQGQLDARADEYIHYAVDASNRMQQLINDLLEFSRVERRGHPFAATDLEKVLHMALANLQGAITDSGAQITHDPLPTVQADAGQLTQVLQNLISNAIKYRSEQPPEIHLSATRLEHGWQVAVRDNGIGIEPQYFDRVFLIFQRLHTRSKYPGTGIGLALCKKIIERHGGKMWIESALNQGATFFFTIPERS